MPLEEHEVKQILRQMGVETPKYRVAFQKGQSVRVTDGPFAEFIGTVDEINPERNKIKVLVSASSAAKHQSSSTSSRSRNCERLALTNREHQWLRRSEQF